MLTGSPAQARELSRAGLSIVAFCAAMNFVSRGFSETFAVFLLPVTGDLGWSRSTYGAVYFTYMATIGLSAPLIGTVLDRLGPRPVYVAGFCLFGSGFFVASVMEHQWQAVAGLGVMTGMGISATGMTAASGLVSRWFERRITLANALAYTGIPLGMVVLVPATQLLIEAADWRTAYLTLALASFCLAPAILFLPWRRISAGAAHVRPRPASAGSALSSGVLRHTAFWGLFATLFLASVTVWSVMLQAVAYLVSVGFDPLVAASAYGAVGAMSVAGLVIFGWASDRFGHRNVVSLGHLLSAAGVGLLWRLETDPAALWLVLFVIVFGGAMGSRGPAVSALVARLYPGNVSAVYGAATIGLGLGGAAGGWLASLLFDLTGSYGAGFAMSMTTSLIGIAVFWMIRPLATGAWPESPPAPEIL